MPKRQVVVGRLKLLEKKEGGKRRRR